MCIERKCNYRALQKDEVKPCGDEFGRRVQKLAKGRRSHGHNNQPQLRFYLFLCFHSHLFCVNPWIVLDGGVDSLDRNLLLA